MALVFLDFYDSWLHDIGEAWRHVDADKAWSLAMRAPVLLGLLEVNNFCWLVGGGRSVVFFLLF